MTGHSRRQARQQIVDHQQRNPDAARECLEAYITFKVNCDPPSALSPTAATSQVSVPAFVTTSTSRSAWLLCACIKASTSSVVSSLAGTLISDPVVVDGGTLTDRFKRYMLKLTPNPPTPTRPQHWAYGARRDDKRDQVRPQAFALRGPAMNGGTELRRSSGSDQAVQILCHALQIGIPLVMVVRRVHAHLGDHLAPDGAVRADRPSRMHLGQHVMHAERSIWTVVLQALDDFQNLLSTGHAPSVRLPGSALICHFSKSLSRKGQMRAGARVYRALTPRYPRFASTMVASAFKVASGIGQAYGPQNVSRSPECLTSSQQAPFVGGSPQTSRDLRSTQVKVNPCETSLSSRPSNSGLRVSAHEVMRTSYRSEPVHTTTILTPCPYPRAEIAPLPAPALRLPSEMVRTPPLPARPGRSPAADRGAVAVNRRRLCHSRARLPHTRHHRGQYR